MSYAIRNDGQGWRAINGQEDICAEETFSDTQPDPIDFSDTPLALLKKLDVDNALTQRNLRETVMLMAEAFKQLSGGAVDLVQIPGVAKVYQVEAEAAALRSKL